MRQWIEPGPEIGPGPLRGIQAIGIIDRVEPDRGGDHSDIVLEIMREGAVTAGFCFGMKLRVSHGVEKLVRVAPFMRTVTNEVQERDIAVRRHIGITAQIEGAIEQRMRILAAGHSTFR